MVLLPRLVDANADIQKLVAFEGAFEKLIDVVAIEGRIEGGVIVQDALEALVALLRYNVSNQNYFRETLSVPLLAPLLFYPPPPGNNPQAEQEHVQQLEAFAFQQWYPPLPPSDEDSAALPERDEQKVINASLVLTVAGLLVEGQGESKRLNQNALLTSGFTRCLIDLALASTAPSSLKSQALHVLAALLRSNRSSQDLLASTQVAPILNISTTTETQSPESNYTRLPERPAVVELVGAAINGVSFAASVLQGLAFRASALDCFDAFVNDNLDARLHILQSMAQTPQDDAPSAGSHIWRHLSQFPDAHTRSGTSLDPYKYLISAMLFAHLIRGSDTAKNEARTLQYGSDGTVTVSQTPDQSQTEDDDDRNSLIQVLVGNLTMAQREHGEATRRERGAGSTSKAQTHAGAGSPLDWTRIQIGYLIVLSTWLWESPAAVSEMLRESSNLQVLIQPVSQGGNLMDPIVSGLCAVVLGIAYEFGPVGEADQDESGILVRGTMYPILHSRIGPDQFAARLHRLRDDSRFKNTGPDVLETLSSASRGPGINSVEEEEGLWFDWSFVDFLKTNFIMIQKSILVEPTSTSATQSSQSTELLDAKRQLEQAKDMQVKSAREIDILQHRIEELSGAAKEERTNLLATLEASQNETETLRAELKKLTNSSEKERSSAASTANANLDEWKKQVEDFKQSHSEEQKLRQETQAQLSLLRSEADKVREQLGEAQAEVSKLQSELRASQQQAEQSKQQAEQAEQRAQSGAAAPNGESVGTDGEKSKEELEKELEDLLILLDELSTKRRTDKKRMREKGMEISDDDDDDEDEDNDVD